MRSLRLKGISFRVSSKSQESEIEESAEVLRVAIGSLPSDLGGRAKYVR